METITHHILAKVPGVVQRVYFTVDDINGFINAGPDKIYTVSDEVTNKTFTAIRQDMRVISIYN